MVIEFNKRVCTKCNKQGLDTDWGKHPTRCLSCLRQYANERYRKLVPQARPEYRITSKVCPGCNELKTRAEFGEKGSYIRDKCKLCAARETKEWRETHPEERRARKRDHYKRHPEYHKAAASAWKKTERGRMVARIERQTWRAIKRGQLVRASNCEFCNLECFTQAAHFDYSKPLEVKWLCRICHSQWDHDNPKSLDVIPKITHGD